MSHNCNDIFEDVYEIVNSNFDQVHTKYGYMVHENNNSVTRKLIEDGYNLEEAYRLSFTTTLVLWMNVSNGNSTP